jgi:ribosomal-protein-alanine N-acetyltransferase
VTGQPHQTDGRPGPELHTARLLLRRWLAADLEPFAAINADPEVMEHFPAVHSRTESALAIARLEAGFERDGYGFWAVELRASGKLAGFVGISPVPEDIPFAPAVEAGWRLAREHWGRGIAHEAAEAALEFGFQTIGLQEIVAYTAARNTRSRRLMERLGMRHDAGADFDHPRVLAGHPLGPHVVYRLRSPRRPARR